MSFFQPDVIFRRAIELMISDVRANPWLIDDIFSDFVCDPMLSTVYGQKEINNVKEWFSKNKIPVFLALRNDLETMPCITIHIGANSENKSLARLADSTPFSEIYDAEDIGRTIKYVVQPFTFTSYAQVTGAFTLPDTVDTSIISPGMVVVDPDTGNGYVVTDKNNTQIFIAAGTVISATKIGILPQYRTFKARREMASLDETITIAAHAHGDPNELIWLFYILQYALFRYREGLFESRNFQVSSITNSEMIRNNAFEKYGENVFSRFITITGISENSWVKSPKGWIEGILLQNNPGRILDQTNGADTEIDGAGIIIFKEDGKVVPDVIDEENEIWVGKDSEPEE